MVGHRSEPNITLRFPSSLDKICTHDLVVHIRDVFDSVTEYHLPAVTILPDDSTISSFIDSLQHLHNDTYFRSDPHTLGQMVLLICHLFDEMNDQMIEHVSRSNLLFF